ncbi:MAG: nuclear transport factor 2 family protein [Myxococcota bacterium]
MPRTPEIPNDPDFIAASTLRDALLGLAKASPELADAHDKAGWLALYSDDAVVADPVGAPPSHVGRRKGSLGDELGRFYEAFIAPSAIAMEPHLELVSEMSVFRAVTIHTTHLKTGLEMHVPANLLYEIAQTDDGLRIRKMHAHWELNRMSRAVLSEGARGLRTVMRLNTLMLRSFGPRWMARYFRASTQGVGRQGKETWQRWAAAPGDQPEVSIRIPGKPSVSPSEFVDASSGLRVGELIASGPTVSGPLSLEWEGVPRSGAFIAELDPRGDRVRDVRLLWDHPSSIG